MPTRLFLFLLVGLGGASLAMQMAWNSRLRAATGSAVLTTILSALVTLLSLIPVWVSGLTPKGSVPAFGALPPWAWSGGAFAAWYPVTALIAVPKLGTTTVFSLVVARQMITALILDTTGAFGVPQIPLSSSRALGVLLLLAGVLLVQRR